MKMPSRLLYVSLLLLTMAFEVGCKSDPPGNTVTENRPNIQVSDLPAKFLDAIDINSESGVNASLASRDSLTLDGTTLIVGPIGANRTVTLGAKSIKLINGARIITNGNQLTLVARTMEFNNSGGIDSFSGENAKAGTGIAGSDGGRVEIYATKTVYGSLRMSLPGQGGGEGSAGAPGRQGAPGRRGDNGVDGFVDCHRGGTDGAQGGPGEPGGVGGTGAAGGNGGDLVLMGAAVKDYQSHFPYQAPAGPGGPGGSGGPGGAGGPGGEGGSGSGHCGGGHGGPAGPAGQPGAAGPNGPAGQKPGKRELK